MPVEPKISNAAARAMLDALTALLNGGSIKIYTGTRPADPDTALAGNTLLGTLPLSATAFGAATDADPGALATANAITSDTTADATGTATWFRAVGSGGTAVIDGNVGIATSDLILDNVNIVAGGTIAVTSWTITQPEA